MTSIVTEPRPLGYQDSRWYPVIRAPDYEAHRWAAMAEANTACDRVIDRSAAVKLADGRNRDE